MKFGNGNYIILFNVYDTSGSLTSRTKVGSFSINNGEITQTEGVAKRSIPIGPVSNIIEHRIEVGFNNAYYSVVHPQSFVVKKSLSDKYEKILNKVKKNIEQGSEDVKLNRDFNVPGLAGSSLDSKTVYIDKRVPEGYDDVKTDKYLLVHEVTEKTLMDKLGFSYPHAHDIALHAEKRAVERDGIDWDKYNSFMQHWIKEIGENVPKELQPTDLDSDKLKHHKTIKQILSGLKKSLEQNFKTSFKDKVKQISQKLTKDVRPEGHSVGEIDKTGHFVWTKHPYNAKHSNGQDIYGWDAVPEHSKFVDEQVSSLAAKHYSKVPDTHKKLFMKLAQKLLSDPARHFRLSSEGDVQKLKLRHLKNAIENNDAKIEYATQNNQPIINISLLKRHGTNKNPTYFSYSTDNHINHIKNKS